MKSLWEPTKQTEAYWWKVIRGESRKWEEDGGADKFAADKDCWLIGGDGYQFTGSETFTVPDGEAKWMTSSHHDEPITLPANVECSAAALATAPQWDNDVSDSNEDTWAAKRVVEWHRREELKSCCTGQWVFKEEYERDRTRWGNWSRRVNYVIARAPAAGFSHPSSWALVWAPSHPPRGQSVEFAHGPDATGWGEREPKPVSTWHGPIDIRENRIPYRPPSFTPTKWHAPTPRPAGWRPFLPVDPNATYGEKQRLIPLFRPWSEPVQMPWRNPDPQKVEEWAKLTDGDGPPDFLSTYLKRLLFMNDYAAIDPHRVKRIEPFGYAESDENTRRLLLTASCGVRYAKSIECIDHRLMHKATMTEEHTWQRGDVGRGLHCQIEQLDADFQGGVKFRRKIDLRWKIRRRDRHFWPIEQKVPGYKLHDSWQAVIAYFASIGESCSRAKAFRLLKKGFKIPEQGTTQSTTQTLPN